MNDLPFDFLLDGFILLLEGVLPLLELVDKALLVLVLNLASHLDDVAADSSLGGSQKSN